MTTTLPGQVEDSIAALEIAHLASPAALAESLPEGHIAGAYIRRDHLDLINDLLVDATFGQLPEGNGRYLIINIMPQSGKSTLICQWFPVWVNELAARLNPDTRKPILPPGRFGLGTYESTLARSWGRQTREAITNNAQYLQCRVDGGSEKMDEWDTTTKGGMLSRSIFGAFTGRPARRLVIDDANKAETVHSKEERDAAWRWWLSVGFHRLHPEAPVIVSQARLHEDDFSGRLLSKNYEGDPNDWMVVAIPALAEEETQPDPLGRELGDPLYRPDVEQTREQAVVFINERMVGAGSYQALAQYQQRPTAPGGKLFKKALMRSWMAEGDVLTRSGVYSLPPKTEDAATRRFPMQSCMRFIILDLATSIKQEADYTVAGVFDLTPQWDLLLIDLYREHLEATDRLNLMSELHRKWRPVHIGIETVGFQLSDVQQARRRGLPILEVPAKGDKWTRALPAGARMDAGQVFFHPTAPWIGDFVDELVSFPNGVHDDQVDVLSYAAIAVDEIAAKTGWSKG